MSFRENVQKKIEIDRLTRDVVQSIGPAESGRKLDRQAMRRLLETASYRPEKERDLELYVSGEEGGARILVLDNDLAIYRTTIQDVVLRKSPTVKEMLSIRNVVKILNDAGVVLSKKEESVRTVRQEALDKLNLSYAPSDMESLAEDGKVALGIEDPDGVKEILSLFFELLGYEAPTKTFPVAADTAAGKLEKKETGEWIFGPAVIYDSTANRLRFLDAEIGSPEKERLEWLNRISLGKEKASLEGREVFDRLKDLVSDRGAIPPYTRKTA
jgi:hypothetical protein